MAALFAGVCEYDVRSSLILQYLQTTLKVNVFFQSVTAKHATERLDFYLVLLLWHCFFKSSKVHAGPSFSFSTIFSALLIRALF